MNTDPRSTSSSGNNQLGPQWPDSPLLVGSTTQDYNTILPKADLSNVDSGEANFFKTLQWSLDGTSLLASNADNCIRTFIVPPNLLEGSKPHELEAYHTHKLPGPVYSTDVHPFFNLESHSTAVYIAAPANLPIRLVSPFSPSILASYPLISPFTETYVAPHSLLFDNFSSHAGYHFFVGSSSEISVFDLNRPGDGPHTTLKTIPSKKNKIVGGGVGMKGIVSTLSCSRDGILAAGTFSRWIGLYDSGGRGSEIGVFRLNKESYNVDANSDGAGVTQLRWSADGRYLIAAERKSDGIGVWDVRQTGQSLAWLRGRKAVTMQRMSFDVVGDQVVAGGVDGLVRTWNSIGMTEGIVDPSYEFKAHEDALSGSTMHPTASILATCSGQRHFRESDSLEAPLKDEDSSSQQRLSKKNSEIYDWAEMDNSLKIWSLYPQASDKESP